MSDEWREAFIIYDPESNGSISAKDCAEAARALGCNPSEWEIQDIISQVTTSAEVTYDQFCAVMQQLDSGGASLAELTNAFAQFDREGKGALLGSELRYILKTMGEVLSDSELDDLFRQAHFSDDKTVDYKEFAGMIMRGVQAPGGGGTGKKGLSKGRERRSMRFHK